MHGDRHLIRRSAEGDHTAFRALYDRHCARVFNLLRRLSGSQAEAEELTQETFLAAYRSLGSWRGEGAFSTWLCGVAVRLYADRRRRSEPETELLTDDLLLSEPASDPLLIYTRREVQQQIERAISALPDECREVFVLVRVEGLRYREAAEWLGVPVGTVQSRLWRATGLLQRGLSDLLEESVAPCVGGVPIRSPRPKAGG